MDGSFPSILLARFISEITEQISIKFGFGGLTKVIRLVRIGDRKGLKSKVVYIDFSEARWIVSDKIFRRTDRLPHYAFILCSVQGEITSESY